jgi:TrmH family RNA methyltransferase
MSDTQTPQGILTVLTRPRYDLQELLQVKNPLFVLLEDLQDPGNLGTIVRTGEGAGVTAILMTRGTVDLYNPKTIRATMGSVYRVPCVYVDSVEDTIKSLHNAGVKTYAAHLEGETYYDSFSFREGTAFLIGNEGNGLTDEAADAASCRVHIPMEGQIESLNAAMAAGILMFEASRQRRHGGM